MQVSRIPLILLLAILASASTLPSQLRCTVYTTDRVIRVRQPRGQWFQPERVQRIEVDTGRIARARDVLEVWVDKQAWPFSLDPHKDVQVIEVSDKMRKAWIESGTLTVGFATQRNAGGELVLRAGLRRLELPAEGVEVTVIQRRTAEIHGTDGYLRLHIDDITRGQVVLDVQGADGSVPIGPRSVKQGDRIELKLADGSYVLVVEQLVNMLIGDDHAVFRLYERAPFERGRVEALLQRVAAAEITFVREGTEHDGEAAAAHLRRKYDAVRDEIETLEQFITEIGSRSSTTGNEYQVKLPDGSTMSSGAWLRQQAALMKTLRS